MLPGVLIRPDGGPGDAKNGEEGDATVDIGAIFTSPPYRNSARVAQSATCESCTDVEQARIRAVAHA